ncbi:hypothetical protein [Acinetobacter nectaris]|uniref:hypothetical protein n=1 Tax=Acinetobacter nectaris TaxID=1219382 RepID=UPI001F42C6F7|nr:hypothetical protein [Acinetobacter nectaris]MCF8998141.1 hypothetical protein [Acinetobacter nectaris]MCF9026933.1 hypothetical protein [Acinetobacter nectaris]MCF9034097.1 hypothetical protein [Acinetobacter nectaris]
MMYISHYKCACCNQKRKLHQKSCPHCGSHALKSPFGFWSFCVFTCLGVAVAVTASNIYFHQTEDKQPTISNSLVGFIQ